VYHYHATSAHTVLCDDRKQLDVWFYENCLIINTDKTKALFFQGRGPGPIHRPVFSLNNKEITYTSNVIFLGIYITENLSWATHIYYLCQNLTRLFI
jgi:hypothetical protein